MNIFKRCLDIKSFSFAFWVLFLSGGIFLGIFGRAVSDLTIGISIPDFFFTSFWNITLWGYFTLIYSVVAIYFVIKRLNQISHFGSFLAGGGIIFYLILSLPCFYLLGSLSPLKLLGSYLYDLVFADYPMLHQALSTYKQFTLDAMKCASEISNNHQ